MTFASLTRYSTSCSLDSFTQGVGSSWIRCTGWHLEITIEFPDRYLLSGILSISIIPSRLLNSISEGSAHVSHSVLTTMKYVFILFRITWWPSARKVLSSWLSTRAVLLYAILIVCVPFLIWCLGQDLECIILIVAFSSASNISVWIVIYVPQLNGSGDILLFMRIM